MRAHEIIGQSLTEVFRTNIQDLPKLHQIGDAWLAGWQDGDELFRIGFSPKSDGIYEVMFSPINTSDTFDFTTDKLDRGKTSIGVFGAVVAYVRQFIHNVRPVGLNFEVFEPKRRSLYLRIMMMLSKELKQNGYAVIQPNDHTLGFIQRRSKAYLKYRTDHLKAKAKDLRDRKLDWEGR